MTVATLSGLYHETHGPAKGEPVILSPGLGGSAAYWAPNISALAMKHRVVLYDHRGTGRSSRQLPDTVTVDDMADDMLILMDELDITRAHIVGHAAGGMAALALALKAPERVGSIVIVNGWTRPDPHFLRCFEARLNLLRHAGPEAFLRAQPIFLYPAPWISQHHGTLDHELDQQMSTFPGAATMEKRIAAASTFDISDRLEEITHPILAYAARDDMLVPFTCTTEGLARAPHAQVELAPWGGHACTITDPQRFTGAVTDFLSRHRLEG
ncbi:MAG: pyrimidine utilization protein D [Sphingomonadales bacterium]|nr:pyrimidine utilization protein D [Sphingomonadales bacterium]MDE2171084.1 pyrimidine utilization protein D [Sphingomonadales bacterium]